MASGNLSGSGGTPLSPDVGMQLQETYRQAAAGPADSQQEEPPKPTPFSLRLSTEEREALDAAAGGMPLGAYIRSRLLGEDVAPRRTRGRFPVKDHEALGRLLGELGRSRIANNLNQLARAVNSGSLPVSPETEADIQETCAAIREMRRELLTALGLPVE
jgi:hypothetical protein